MAPPAATENRLTAPQSASVVAPAAMSDDELGKSIREKHGMMLRQFKSSVLTAIEIGELLHVAKGRAGHGNFEAWVKDHCQISYRSARRYMQMANNKERLLAQLNAPAAPAVLGDLSASRLLTDQSGGSAATSTPTNVAASDKYDRAEDRLIDTLQKLPVDKANDAMAATVKKLKATVSTMQAGATNKAA